MIAPNTSKRLLAIALLVLAGLLGWRAVRQRSGPSEQAFFYDQSRQQLFKAPRTAIPPIRGVDGPEEDAARAVVISTTGKPGDKSSWTVAYLEQYSPELKRQMEAAQAQGTSPIMGRTEAQQHRFVRRLTDREWFALNTPEAEVILTGWAAPGPNGITPVVCTP
ncbi:MAG TPA: hypothetical protein PKM73_03810 [Verrucomicrobiota bacterium]|nr:hypothetical protein [Verrucomicrobiota bacterium]HNU50813.1 hypothetical protein [Verrucomicrobiota bacterium]